MLATMLALVLAAQETPKPERPKADVVFVLDTTGSMGGLLDGAKKKIWSIANELLKGSPKPELRVGLVAYRDKGDAYVTQVTDLTPDLDKIYEILLGFQAQGGGDGPENVRQGMHDAVTKISWSKERKAFKVMFLVGDAPPHLDYDDVPKIEDICLAAVKADITINAVRCGGDPDTGRIWQDIASRSEGTFASIDQGGGVVAIATPYDKEIGELSDKVGRTVVAFGDPSARRELERKEGLAASAPAPAKADRAAAKSAGGALYEADLVDAVKDGRKRLEDLKPEELPAEIKDKSPEERKAWLDAKTKERAELQKQVVELSKKREQFIADELAKRGEKDGFDSVVKDALRKQAEKKGIEFAK
jgi:Mg-chelatase subunit ChlD